MYKFTLSLLGALGIATAVWAATIIPKGRSVALDSTAVTAPATSVNVADLSQGFATASVFYTGTSGTLSTQLQVSCDQGTTWISYPGVAAVTAIPAITLLNPPIPCQLRLNTTSCSAGCSMAATIFLGAKN